LQQSLDDYGLGEVRLDSAKSSGGTEVDINHEFRNPVVIGEKKFEK